MTPLAPALAPAALPLAGAGDLVGLLFFVVVAILSALSKRAQAGAPEAEEETPRPARRPEPKRPEPRRAAPPAPAPRQETTLEGEMKRFLEEMRRAHEAPDAPTARPAPTPAPAQPRPVFAPRGGRSTLYVPRRPAPRATPPPMPVEEEPSEGPRAPALAEIAPNLRAELGQSLEALHQEMEVTHTELREVAPPSALEAAPATASPRLDPATFRSPESARHAVLLSEILGPPRALKPW
jgi:hypothetical protein